MGILLKWPFVKMNTREIHFFRQRLLDTPYKIHNIHLMLYNEKYNCLIAYNYNKQKGNEMTVRQNNFFLSQSISTSKGGRYNYMWFEVIKSIVVESILDAIIIQLTKKTSTTILIKKQTFPMALNDWSKVLLNV